ncbi:MAG: hypothetical protein U5L10_03510 [Candidatus Moranbacteria bacterium]|nr:hypothetical protein [Candidatus Moranbacteria bacterium]
METDRNMVDINGYIVEIAGNKEIAKFFSGWNLWGKIKNKIF